MTVLEAVKVLQDAKRIALAWDGCLITLNTKSVLEMAAYGDFEIKAICSYAAHDYEIEIAVQPIKKTV